MKHVLLYILLLTGTFSDTYAQDNTPAAETGRKQQKIQALYVAYITQQLNLTETEAQRFWPLHKQFDTEIKSVKLEATELSRQQAQLDIKKKYQDRFTAILGSSRSNDFFRIDDEFRKKLIDELRKRRQQNNSEQHPGKRRNF